MKRKVLTAALSAALLAIPAFAGALLLAVADPQTSPEALSKKAVVMVNMTACHSPEKSTVIATAEGIAGGVRKTLPLKVIRLGAPGVFAVARQWPNEGVWAVRFVATNPDYKDYATGVVVPVHGDTYNRTAAKQFFHAPTANEVDSTLKQATLE